MKLASFLLLALAAVATVAVQADAHLAGSRSSAISGPTAVGGPAATAPSRALGTEASSAADEPYLDTYPESTSVGRRGELDLFLHLPTMSAAKIEFFVPRGYAMRIDQAPGTYVGDSVAWAGDRQFSGLLNPEDPGRYVADPEAQACASGVHAAVWTFKFHQSGTSEQAVPIFIDPTTGSDADLGAYKLQFCLRQPQTAALGLDSLEFDVMPLTNPANPGAYHWRAVVTPASPNGAADTGRAFELRSVVPLPSRLTLSGRYDRRTKRVTLSGRLVAPAYDVRGTPVDLYAKLANARGFKYAASTTMNGRGAFGFLRHLTTTTSFGVQTNSVEDCIETAAAPEPAAAPAGCRNETLETILSPVIRVRRT